VIVAGSNREYDLRMHSRETAVNLLLGVVLVLIFAVLVGAVVATFGIVLYATDLVVKHVFPGLARSWNAEFYGVPCLWSLIAGIGHLRKLRLRNTFLSLAIIPMIVSVWFASPNSPLRDNAFFMWPWFMVLLIPADSLLTKLEFTLGGFVVTTTFAVNAGLLGSGTFARVATDCVFVAVFALVVVYFRREQRKRRGLVAAPFTTA
jgi:hypothetical protein